ncbi:MAG TPA: hypothetical protein PLQ00_16155, partial [Thermoguttaceae bacterium]|nr:hypothetical protein [Thermoguttaceae bacterium]
MKLVIAIIQPTKLKA